ncbi:hypothetical protein [Halomonas sp. BC2]|uniref:hypothetical protein n=1 Tax=Halomonas sp. BC2 TaxID=1670449 RepID=UPI001117DEAB|nr:hypothetical protein [Halomonas sp. BC2]
MAIFIGYICFRLLMLVSANIPGKRNGVAKVAGSNPVTPTNIEKAAAFIAAAFFSLAHVGVS